MNPRTRTLIIAAGIAFIVASRTATGPADFAITALITFLIWYLLITAARALFRRR